VPPGKRKHSYPRLLLVEQRPHVIDELRDLFPSPEFECEVAMNVETAFDILTERRMDGVVLDAGNDSIPRGGVSGLISRFKEADKGMKVVIFNGVGRKATQRKLRRLGADGYLSKKSDLNAVSRSVRNALGVA